MPNNFTTPHMETLEGTVGEKHPVGLANYGTAKSGNLAACDVTKGEHLTMSRANADASGNMSSQDCAGPAFT